MSVANLDLVGTTTAKFMDTLDQELGAMEQPAIAHVCVIAEVHYIDGDGDENSHVILATDEDSRILQIGITTAAQNAAIYGDAVEGAE